MGNENRWQIEFLLGSSVSSDPLTLWRRCIRRNVGEILSVICSLSLGQRKTFPSIFDLANPTLKNYANVPAGSLSVVTKMTTMQSCMLQRSKVSVVTAYRDMTVYRAWLSYREPHTLTVSFTMVIKKSPGGESAGAGRSTSKSTCVVLVRELWPRKLLLGSVQDASRWSHQLTSDPKRCLLFWKCLQWPCLKAVSVATFVIGGLWGSIVTSGSCCHIKIEQS